jgi:Purine catabolism regulatory protein-like family
MGCPARVRRVHDWSARRDRESVTAGDDRYGDVSEQRNPAATLSGGELILSIGVNLADPTTDHEAYIGTLRDSGAVGLVVELGQRVNTLPTALLQAARTIGFPVIELVRGRARRGRAGRPSAPRCPCRRASGPRCPATTPGLRD